MSTLLLILSSAKPLKGVLLVAAIIFLVVSIYRQFFVRKQRKCKWCGITYNGAGNFCSPKCEAEKKLNS
jgi:hypothetical protein